MMVLNSFLALCKAAVIGQHQHHGGKVLVHRSGGFSPWSLGSVIGPAVRRHLVGGALGSQHTLVLRDWVRISNSGHVSYLFLTATKYPAETTYGAVGRGPSSSCFQSLQPTALISTDSGPEVRQIICEGPQFWIHSNLTKGPRVQPYSTLLKDEWPDVWPKVWLRCFASQRPENRMFDLAHGYQVYWDVRR